MKRATIIIDECENISLISIHTLCEEGDKITEISRIETIISIHTLCEEGDGQNVSETVHDKISIHTLCEEGDYRRKKI